MNLPIGKLFYFVPKIAAYASGGNHYAPYGAPGTANVPATPGAPYSAVTTSLYDEYYEGQAPLGPTDGLYDYSKGSYTTTTGTVQTASWTGNVLAADSLIFPHSGCVRTAILVLSGFSSTGVGQLTGPDGNEQDSEEFLASLQLTARDNRYCCDDSVNGGVGSGAGALIVGTTGGTATPLLYRVVTQKYGFGIVDRNDTCDSTGAIYLEADLSCPACITCTSVDGYVGSSASTIIATAGGFYASWRNYATLEFEDEMGEVSFDLQAVTVSVTERKLRAQWSPELAQDVSAFHNIDAEAELTALLSEEVAAEIDREILLDLRKGAAWRLRWDYNGWKRFAAGQAPYTQKDWNQTLITAINQLSAQIHKSTLRGGANWIVVSSEVSAIFDDLEYFHVSNASPEQDSYNMGIEKIGTLSGRFTVYRDPYFPSNQVLIGHKGTSLLDTGYVYAPYVPLQLTPTMYNPFNFTPIKGIMTRYAKKMVNNRFYGRITVDGVRTFNVRELKR
tara:strand:- start:1512 stop:3023 length:1512 start_codon:yes stop_codon:yes gene_type:complete